MVKLRFQQAVELYNTGDKQGAQTLLTQIVVDEPENADAWYGLALCAQSDEERLHLLEKCLAINPEHSKAQRAFAKITKKRKVEQFPPRNSMEQEDQQSKVQDKEEAVSDRKRRFSFAWLNPLIFLILAGLVIWQFIRIDRLEKTSVQLVNKTDALDQDVDYLISDVIDLTSGLNYATALAKNADRYAHSHSYSDSRLKTEIQEIQNPLDKLMQIRGVYYRWNVVEHPRMGFNNDTQIGVIAQEVEVVYPELVMTDHSGFKQVDYERLTAVLIEAIREQQEEIEFLHSRINQLEEK